MLLASAKRIREYFLKTSAGVANIEDGNGTVASPVSYSYAPATTEIFRIAAIHYHTTGDKPTTVTNFENGTAALTNGLIFRKADTSGELFKLFPAIKSTADLLTLFPVVDWKTVAATPFAAGLTLKEHYWLAELAGQFIDLDGSKGEKFEVLVQDNMTTATPGTNFDIFVLVIGWFLKGAGA